MTLDHLQPGNRGKITQISGEETLQARLSSIGLIPGATMTTLPSWVILVLIRYRVLR